MITDYNIYCAELLTLTLDCYAVSILAVLRTFRIYKLPRFTESKYVDWLHCVYF
jgi:hypothetical protein